MKRILFLFFAVALWLSANAQDECMQPDVNCDGYVNVNDLLGLLSYFGAEDLDGDGIWDSQDDCVDDGCGVCDGPGPQVMLVDTIILTVDSIFIDAINEWYVYEVPDTTFIFVCENPGCTDPEAENYDPDATEDDGSCVEPLNPCSGLISLYFDGHTYDLVAIGNQCWFAENLRSDHYANGEAIPGELSDEDWTVISTGAQAIYNNDDSFLSTHGRLYNWLAVDDSRGLCPSGWHVPTNDEFTELTDFLGGYSVAGNAMKSSPSDVPNWDGSNTSGFSALAGGRRIAPLLGQPAFFGGQGNDGWFWSSSGGMHPSNRKLESGSNSVFDGHLPLQAEGMSVRCVRDSDATDVNEVSGCTDASASNYNPSAVIEDGSCVYGPADPCENSSTITFDGYMYDLVLIGDQCWFAENLRTEHYANGDAIPGELSDIEWSNTTEGAQAVYNNDASNLADYGRLYNWHSVEDARGLCPSGWHVPSHMDFISLEIELGMDPMDAYWEGFRGTDQGDQMKSTFPSWDGSNASGFSALPGGIKFNYGVSEAMNYLGTWWTNSENGVDAWYRELHSENPGVLSHWFNGASGQGGPNVGRSIRCMRECVDLDSDGICNEQSGCTNPNAINFDPEASEDDGSCLGIDPCVTPLVEFDGYVYDLVAIGDQCWFAENLRTEHYANGDAIPGELSDSDWYETSTGAQAIYNNDDSFLSTHGRLYNWYAVDDSRGLCPSGWHVPTDAEFMTLEMALGMSESEANSTGWRGTDQGAQMKSSPSDDPFWDGTNTSGYSAMTGGFRYYEGWYYGGTIDEGQAFFWTSTPIGIGAYYRGLVGGVSEIARFDLDNDPRDGVSIRCVRDE